MKQLITLSILLLGPSLASAQAAPNFNVTSGSMNHIFNSSDFPYTIAGPGFSSSGDITPLFPSDFDQPVGPGTFNFELSGSTATEDLSFNSLTVHGVPWDYPNEGGVVSAFGSTVTFGAHPGTYHSTFIFFSQFVGGPASAVAANPDQCVSFPFPPNCMQLNFSGSGTVTWDLIPDPNFPGQFDISHVTFTFKTPEPSTTSLLLLGVAGLVLLGHRRRSRATLIPAG